MLFFINVIENNFKMLHFITHIFILFYMILYLFLKKNKKNINNGYLYIYIRYFKILK